MENTYILQAPGMRVPGMIFADEYHGKNEN